ncbi:tyrosine-type recombinase/integrase [Neoroseomonas soli]|uniref:Tyrosine-type recombinase/integrase n=1 Tax=Neoroseomonas soli TaxID=1081025 RepID=A0A9X9WX45_9PROT|nr:tyrosine-type recombinase/integrase [Neoroseomonas soli]MBR0671724.1 tyrosine-type recombinase/integrase [Neoroseomonas soli]
MTLTDAALRKAGDGAIMREGGLEFRFFAEGKAGVRFVGRVRGTNQRIAIGLGRYPTLSLRAAREIREAHSRLCAQGIDPRHVRQEAAQAQQRFVAELLEQYLGTLTDNRPRTVADKRSTLGQALEGWRKRPIGSIARADVARLLDDYARKPAARRKVFSYVSHFLRWCQDRDLIDHNPCRDIRPPKPVAARERVLTDVEIAALMKLHGSIWGTMLQLMLLTGQRGGEVCKMRVSEIDLAARTWTIPAATMKQGRTHVVPLSAAAAEIVGREIRERPEGWGPYLFGVGSKGEKPYNGRSNGMEEVLKLTGTAGWYGHDCRRTAITLMQRVGIAREVRQRVTGHAAPRDGAASYERHRFDDEARRAVERLADEVGRIVRGGAEIIHMRGA